MGDRGGLWRLVGGNVLVKLISAISWPLAPRLRPVLHSSQVAAAARREQSVSNHCDTGLELMKTSNEGSDFILVGRKNKSLLKRCAADSIRCISNHCSVCRVIILCRIRPGGCVTTSRHRVNMFTSILSYLTNFLLSNVTYYCSALPDPRKKIINNIHIHTLKIKFASQIQMQK